MEDRLLTAAEAALLLRVSRDTVWAQVREGLFPPGVVIRLGQRIRFDAARLTAWLDAGGQPCGGNWRREA